MVRAKKNVTKTRIVIRAYDHHLVDDAAKNIIESVERTGAVVSGPVPMPTKIKKFSVLRSTNVNKKSFEQFEIRIHKRIIDINEPNSETIPTLKSLNMPSGVDIEMK